MANQNSITENRAVSVHQPYAEQTMTGEKKIEYRSRSTSFPTRVYISASKTVAKGKE